MKKKSQRTAGRSGSPQSEQSESGKVNRRSFVKLLPALGAAGFAAARMPVTFGQTTQPTAPLRVSKELLEAYEKLIGIELNDAQEAMALPNVNRSLESYETLRKIEIPLDTEPAIAFHPAPPGKVFKGNAVRFKPTKTEAPSFEKIEDLAFATVPQLAQLIRTKAISPVELTKMYIARLKRYGPKLNCVITLTEELALAQATQAEKETRAGRYRGPLHGIPWGAKDLFATKGIRTTWGAEPFRDQVIDYDATVVERLRDAGAILVAKLSMGALAQGAKWFGGVTRNPWQIEEDKTGSSGSSAGPAAATAAGLVGFSIGTETLGSIMSPSSKCGVTGLRPTYGRVSRYGAMGLSWTMDKIGPICRGVEDCAVALNAIYGPDSRDITVGEAPFRWNPELPVSQLRVGYLKSEFETGDENRKAVYKAALDALRTTGAKLQEIELPKLPAQSLRIILTSEAAAAFDDITRNGAVNQLSGQEPFDWPNSFRSARFIPAVEYLRAQRARTLLMQQMDVLMRSWDVFVSPAPGSASLLITNLTGHPAVAVPCGFINNLPQSIMFTGGIYDEGAPLRLALAFEQATKWHTMHPKVDWA